jgi:Alw26I/Eco31I/Esp3I family type II restriction m6 adenine DNA methyltransferase
MPRTKKKSKKNGSDLFVKNSYKVENECWKSSLFHEAFLRNDMHRYFKEFKETDQNNDYDKFLEGFRNLVIESKDKKFLDEDSTIDNFIIDVMDLLGWVKADPKKPHKINNYSKKLNISKDDGEKGELDLYFTEEIEEKDYIEQKRGSTNEAFHRAKEYVLINVEAKAWGQLTRYKVGNEYELSKKEIKEIRGSDLTPPEQGFKYMSMLEHDFTIVTDGNTWQLQNREASEENNKRCYEFDLGKLRQFVEQLFDDEASAGISWDFIQNEGRYFYYLFSKETLHGNKKPSPVMEMLIESSKYSTEVQKNLKFRFLESMNIVANAYGADLKKNGFPINDEATRELLRGAGENLLFTIMFIKSLESNGIINPYVPGYENEYSLTFIINSIDPKCTGFDPDSENKLKESVLRKKAFNSVMGFEKEFSFKGFELYERVLSLINVVERGKFGFSIKQFTKAIFTTQERSILKNHKINNGDMVEILFKLGFSEKGKKTSNIRERFAQIPYDYFAPSELGSIYESFLEFKLEFAENHVFFNTKLKQWQDIEGNPSQYAKNNKIDESKIVKKGKLYFVPNNADRKMTGSYYTPDPVVRDVIKRAIRPFEEKLKSDKFSKLKVIDPTMGSGHFLNGALVYMTNIYRAKLLKEKKLNESYSDSMNTILTNCIYGFDINDRAVKLAKMSIWLTSARPNKELTSLKEKIAPQDTLIPKTSKYKKGFVDNKTRYDLIVGNPPWDKLKFQDDEFYKSYSKELLGKKVKKAKKKEIYDELSKNKAVQSAYQEQKELVERKIEAVKSQYYEYQEDCGGAKARFVDFNLYKLACERFTKLLVNNGRMGLVVPTGLFGDLGCTGIRKFFINENDLESIVGFSKNAKVFEISQPFCIFTLTKGGRTKSLRYVDNLVKDDLPNLSALVEKAVPLTDSFIKAFSPDTYTIPYIKDKQSFEILKKCFSGAKEFGTQDLDVSRELHQTDDDGYLTNKEGTYPVVKGDEIDHFEFRGGVKQYLNKSGIERHFRRLSDPKPKLALRAISGTTDPRRLVAAVLPKGMLTINSLLVATCELEKDEMYFYLALLNSRPIEFVFRLISKNNNVNKFAVSILPILKYNPKNKKMAAISSLSEKVSGLKNKGTGIEKIEELVCGLFGLSGTSKKYLEADIQRALPVSQEKKAA